MDIEFLKDRLNEENAELKRLYVERSKSSVNTEGEYDIQIERRKREIKKIEAEIADLKEKNDNATKQEASKDLNESIDELDTPIPEVERTIGNYPITIPYFTERIEKIAEFQDAYANYNFISISGMGGIGKTQFVAKGIAAFSIPKEKIIWFECEPATTLDAVIDYSGFSEILKGDSKRDKEKVLAFIDKINEHQLILFLEDFHYVSKKSLLIELLKACNTKLRSGKVIVISRDNMVDFTIQPKQIFLKGFENEKEILDYIANLKDFLRIENDFSDNELLELCMQLEGHPFAIYLAFILISKGISIDEIIVEIVAIDDDENVSERLLNAIFKRKDASKEEKEFIKEFSAFRGKVDLIDIENVFSKEKIKTARKLQSKNLLVIQDGKISLHPLVREFCYKRLNNKQGVHQEISKYYITQRSEKLVAELEDRIFYHLTRGQENEKINDTIEKLGRQFIQQGFTGILQNMIENQNAIFEELPEISDIFYGDILEIKGEWDKALTFYEKAYQAANVKVKIEGLIKKGEILYRKGEVEKANNLFDNAINVIESNKGKFLKEKALALNSIGVVQSGLGNIEEALELLEKSLKIRKEIGDKSGIASCYNNIGGLKVKLGKNAVAMEMYEKSLKIQEEIGEKSGIASSCNNIAGVKSDIGKRDEALKLYEKSLKIRQEIGEKSGIASSYNNIAYVKFNFGKNDEALGLYKKSLKILEEIGEKSGIASSYNNIAGLKSKLGKKEEALKLFEQSLRIREEIGDKSGIATSYNNIAGVKADLGKKEEALKLYEQSLRIREEIGDKSGIASSYNNIAGVKADLGKKEEALKLYEQSLRIRQEIEEKSGIATSFGNIGIVKSDLGKKDEALDWYEKSLKLCIEIGDKSGIAANYNCIGNLKSDLGKKDEALDWYEKSLKLCIEIGEKPGVASNFGNIGVILYKRKNPEKACSYFLQAYLLLKQMKLPEQKNIKSWLIAIRKENKNSFKEIAQNAYEALDDDLKKDYDENEVYGMPLKSKPKMGRNEKCHCGSGKKYKHCHGRT